MEALDDAADQMRDAGAWISWKFPLVFALALASAVAVPVAVATNCAIGRFTLCPPPPRSRRSDRRRPIWRRA